MVHSMESRRARPGRPKKDPALIRGQDLRIPVTTNEKAIIQQAAAREGSGEMAQWARTILLTAAKRRFKDGKK